VVARWGAVGGFTMAAVGLAGCAPHGDRGVATVKARTVYGAVAGKVRSPGVVTFLGVPFARAPAGPLRFKPPRPPQPWTGVRDAFDFGPSCPQLEDPFEPSSRRTKSEDCLHVNVWTPAADDAKRPVMVWIHGGGFINGGTADPMYDGTTFVQNGNVVFVSFNYRVGVLGWLYLGHIDPNYPDSGNAGLLDQVAGLRWVQDNIAHFGGDPGNVTIMGESAGAGSVTTLMATPAAKGLFHKVIAQSGSPSFCRDVPTAIRYANKFLAIAGTNQMSGLREMPIGKLLRCYTSFESAEGLNASRAMGPVVGDPVLPKHPCDAIAQGQAAGIRLLHGTNRDEVKYWIMYFLPFNWWSPERVLERYAEALRLLKDQATAKQVIAYYRKKMKGSRDGDISHAMFTDVFFWIPAVQLAEAQAGHGETWMYQFTWPSPVWFGMFGSHHALELPFVFNNFDPPGAKEMVGSHPPRQLAELMQNAWIAFARDGTPGHAGIPDWPPYRTTGPPSNRRATMFFDIRPGPVVRYDPAPDIRELYKGILY
jgi:para-nitrobenzyl esterase